WRNAVRTSLVNLLDVGGHGGETAARDDGLDHAAREVPVGRVGERRDDPVVSGAVQRRLVIHAVVQRARQFLEGRQAAPGVGGEDERLRAHQVRRRDDDQRGDDQRGRFVGEPVRVRGVRQRRVQVVEAVLDARQGAALGRQRQLVGGVHGVLRGGGGVRDETTLLHTQPVVKCPGSCYSGTAPTTSNDGPSWWCLGGRDRQNPRAARPGGGSAVSGVGSDICTYSDSCISNFVADNRVAFDKSTLSK